MRPHKEEMLCRLWNLQNQGVRIAVWSSMKELLGLSTLVRRSVHYSNARNPKPRQENEASGSERVGA